MGGMSNATTARMAATAKRSRGAFDGEIIDGVGLYSERAGTGGGGRRECAAALATSSKTPALLDYLLDRTKSTLVDPLPPTVTDFSQVFGWLNTGRWTLRSVRTS